MVIAACSRRALGAGPNLHKPKSVRRYGSMLLVVVACACANEHASQTGPAPGSDTGKAMPTGEVSTTSPSGSGQLDPPASPPPTALRVYVLDCGVLEAPDLDRFADDGSLLGGAGVLGNMCVLVRHPDGDLLWDAGLPDTVASEPTGREWAGFHITLGATLDSQLVAMGVPPVTIEFFAMSHSHGDHVGNVALVADATWIVDPAENTASLRPATTDGSPDRTIEYVDDHDVFGDGQVRIVRAPGHTPGHAVLFVELPNAGPHVFAGDLYILAESRERQLVPRNNTSHEQTLTSMAKVEQLVQDTGARLVIQHDAEQLLELPQPPAYLD